MVFLFLVVLSLKSGPQVFWEDVLPKPKPPGLFALVTFWAVSYIFAWVSLDCCSTHVSSLTVHASVPELLIEMGVLLIFCLEWP